MRTYNKLLQTNVNLVLKFRVGAAKFWAGAPKFRVGTHRFRMRQSLKWDISYLTNFKQVIADVSGTFQFRAIIPCANGSQRKGWLRHTCSHTEAAISRANLWEMINNTKSQHDWSEILNNSEIPYFGHLNGRGSENLRLSERMTLSDQIVIFYNICYYL